MAHGGPPVLPYGVHYAGALLLRAIPILPEAFLMTTARSFAGSVNAPDFPDGIEWLNTDRPLAMADLRGKVVVLDFWTYC